jgi:hypothetical protein
MLGVWLVGASAGSDIPPGSGLVSDTELVYAKVEALTDTYFNRALREIEVYRAAHPNQSDMPVAILAGGLEEAIAGWLQDSAGLSDPEDEDAEPDDEADSVEQYSAHDPGSDGA